MTQEVPALLPKPVELMARACARLGLEFHILDDHYKYLFEVRGPGFRRVLIGGVSPLNDMAASRIARDKHYTSLILGREGIRVPASARCLAPGHFQDPRYRAGTGPEPGLAFAARHGFPVIAKPNHASKGRGVCEVNDSDGLFAALERIFGFDHVALVQPVVPEPDLRLDFLDGRYLLGYERLPLTVTGDGTSSVRALVERADERFCEDLRWRHTDRDIASVPAPGHMVRLGDAVLNLHGFARAEFIETIPDAWLAHAVRIGDIMGLRHFGIDFRGAALSDPPERATVIEVNASPAVGRIHDLGWPDQAIDAQVRVLQAVVDTHP